MFYTYKILQFLEYEDGYAIGMRQLSQRIKADDVQSAIKKVKEMVRKFNELKTWQIWDRDKAFHRQVLTDITRSGQNVFRSYMWP